MPNYRRPRIPGATIFFTVCLASRGADLLVRHVDILREAVRQARARKRFEIQAWVTLTDHFHAILTLAPHDADYPNVIGAIKSRFSRDLRRAGLAPPTRPGRKGESGIWQPRYWEHHIRSRSDFQRLVSYCNQNPVRHGLVQDPFEWPYSSIHRDMRTDLRRGIALTKRDDLGDRAIPTIPQTARPDTRGEPDAGTKGKLWPNGPAHALSPAPATR